MPKLEFYIGFKVIAPLNIIKNLFFNNFYSFAVNLYKSTKFQLCTFVGSVPIGICKINMEIPMSHSKIVTLYKGAIYIT